MKMKVYAILRYYEGVDTDSVYLNRADAQKVLDTLDTNDFTIEEIEVK
jgi:DNA-dependent RNA polymerase auxiliary subunit epsilon